MIKIAQNSLITQNEYALVIIDMQPHFLFDKDPIDLEKKIGYQIKQLEKAKAYNLPIFFIEYGYQPTTNKLDRNGAFTYKKFQPNSFSSQKFKEKVEELSPLEIQLMGCNAGACVLSTALVGKNLNYKISIHLNGVLSFRSLKKNTDYALKQYEKYEIQTI